MPIADVFVSVVAPLRNGAAWVESFVQDTAQILRQNYSNYELIIVDDGSTDDSHVRVSALLQVHPCIRLIRLSRAFGTETAITAGLDSVIGDWVVVMLPERDPPKLIPGLVEKARTSRCLLLGMTKDRTGQPLVMRMLTRLFYTFAIPIFRLPLIPDATQFQVLHRQAVNGITAIKDRFRYLRLATASIGYTTEYFPYQPVWRSKEGQGRGFFESLDLALTLVTSATAHPLRIASWLAICASGINLLYAMYVLAIFLFKQQVQPGWVTLSLQGAGMFFVICLILAMLSEYVGRILEETRSRPLYHVLEERNSSVMIADATRRNVIGDSVEHLPPEALAG